MRILTLALSASVAMVLAGSAQAQSTAPGTAGGSMNNPGSVGTGSATPVSPGAGAASVGPGTGATRSPNAAPLPSTGRSVPPAAGGSGSAPTGALPR